MGQSERLVRSDHVSQVMGQSREGQERTGGSREVPDLRNLVHEVPFFVEGTLKVPSRLKDQLRTGLVGRVFLRDHEKKE